MAYEMYRDILNQMMASITGAQAQEQARYAGGITPYREIVNIYQPGGAFEQAARQEAYRGFARYLNPQQAGLFRMRNVSTLKPAMAASIGPQIQLARTQGLAAALGGLGAATQRYPLMPNFGAIASLVGAGLQSDAAMYGYLRRYPPQSTGFMEGYGNFNQPPAAGSGAGGGYGGGGTAAGGTTGSGYETAAPSTGRTGGGSRYRDMGQYYLEQARRVAESMAKGQIPEVPAGSRGWDLYRKYLKLAAEAGAKAGDIQKRMAEDWLATPGPTSVEPKKQRYQGPATSPRQTYYGTPYTGMYV